ncbi:MAG: SDR family oxidoreductase [Fervidicoccaceae archaeon]
MYPKRFEGKVCVVTGGAKGIGAAISSRLGIEGCTVFIADIDETAGRIREGIFRNEGIDAHFVNVDVSKETDVEKLMRLAGGSRGKIDVLINNAGIPFTGNDLEKQSSEEFMRIIGTNLYGPWICAKHSLKYMKKDGGVIINIASTRAYQSEENTEPYSASKGGILALTHALAISLSKYRIRVISVSPGWIDTSEWQIPPRKPKLNELDHIQHPAGRVGKPEDVASLIAFLASSEAEWITAADFIIDGGMTKKMIYLDEEIIKRAIEALNRGTS